MPSYITNIKCPYCKGIGIDNILERYAVSAEVMGEWGIEEYYRCPGCKRVVEIILCDSRKMKGKISDLYLQNKKGEKGETHRET